jgi:hypothetical protein
VVQVRCACRALARDQLVQARQHHPHTGAPEPGLPWSRNTECSRLK